MSRVRARVEGTVQGVGFRPYVYRLAGELGVAGHVLNDSRGVVVEVEAPAETVERFLARLPLEAPPLATVERVTAGDARGAWRGAASRSARARRVASRGPPSRPDSATCADCLAELFDPADRRYRYPFTNCTNCGPRFTIVRDVPYDRAQHHDGRVRDVPGVPARVRRSRRPPLPRPAECLPGLRAAAACVAPGGGADEPVTRSRRPRARCSAARSWR